MKTEDNNAGMDAENRDAMHLNLDAMVDAYYGACTDPAGVHEHLASCDKCAERWNELARKRSAAVRPVEVSAEFLAAQRRKIYERIEQPSQKRSGAWVPAAAAAVLLTAAIFAFRPAPETPRPEAALRPEINDAQLFSDVYSLDQTYAPSAVEPIQALFVEDQK